MELEDVEWPCEVIGPELPTAEDCIDRSEAMDQHLRFVDILFGRIFVGSC